MLLKFGEPDGRASDDSWFTYGSTRVWRAGAVMLSPDRASPFGYQRQTTSRLTIGFDQHGVVTKVEFHERTCSGSWKSLSDAELETCLDVTGRELQQELARYEGVEVRRSPADCRFAHALVELKAEPLVITSKSLAVGTLRIQDSDVADVLPLEEHDTLPWLVLRTRDGACVYVWVPSVTAQELTGLRDSIARKVRGS